MTPMRHLLALLLSLLATPASAGTLISTAFQGRDMLIYFPARLAPPETRALVIVLHGGFGNAERIAAGANESALNMDAQADADGFIVAYLNGTQVARLLGADKRGWNAGGGCCGLPAKSNIDDVGYITAAAAALESRYAVTPARIYGIGHSNGAMMTQRLFCETTLFTAAIAISGPLNTADATCPVARGRRLLAIHGADDQNVPIAGGEGTKGYAHIPFNSEAHTQQVYAASGATYILDIVPGADHNLDDIDAALRQNEGAALQAKAAAFFGLTPPAP